MLTKRESLAETRLPLKINLYVTIWTSAILAERLYMLGMITSKFQFRAGLKDIHYSNTAKLGIVIQYFRKGQDRLLRMMLTASITINPEN